MVQLKKVSKRFGEFTAVEKIDLNVGVGEFLTLLGPSGCGKTTLLRMIAGFETPTEGSIHLDGRDVTHVPPNKRDVNQVFQSYALFPHLNVWDNIAFGLHVKRVPRAEITTRVADAIRLVALTGMERRKPDQLSGGQRQRVALARAVVNRPKVLLLDEPLGALDAELRRTMQLELKTLQRSLGITFIFVTHDQEEALSMSDRIAVMNRGRIEQIDAAQAIYRRPTTPFVARFIGGGNVFDCTATPDGVRLISGEMLKTADAKDAIAVCVRPEQVRVLDQPKAGSNGWTATVVEQLFRGSNDQLQLLTAGGLGVQASVEAGRWKRGEAVYLWIDAADVVVLREAER
jgi:spermidine/putrescine transport system ATP-binding protein